MQLIDENKQLNQKLDELQSSKNAMPNDNAATVASGNDSDTEAKKRCAELETIVQNLQIELSNAIGEKLECEDMKKTYIDELDCIQVNLVATEELYKMTKSETMELKATNSTLKQNVESLERTLAAQKEEMNVINAQVKLLNIAVDFTIE